MAQGLKVLAMYAPARAHAALDAHSVLHGSFRWQVPASFNIAQVCCTRWAQGAAGRRTAIAWEHEDGRHGRLSYAQLQARADRLSHALRALGVQRGDRVAVVMPQSAMIAVHEQLHIGALPTEPIVGYLARTASMFYGFVGVLLLYLSTDVVRHRDVIRFVAGCGMMAGLLVFAIDLAEGLPMWWILLEGPSCGLLAALVWWMTRPR